MKTRDKMKINFFTMFKTADGKQHWSIHSYDNISRSVSTMKDFIFEDSKIDCQDVTPHARFYVVADVTGTFQVFDRIHDTVIGVFRCENDAHEFCESKNSNELYREAIESFEF